MKLKVILEKGEDGFIVAHCPSLKSCWSQGETEEEAIRNIQEAITLYLEPNPEDIIEDEKHKLCEMQK
ncbi:type II toxin-antitoxin system HicB family antitoxin [candidate division WOR-3 bacterium]|nr:type II toxin-antitoxin system HicB family antitoxin [candidate division WOR-3 bacterium]